MNEPRMADVTLQGGVRISWLTGEARLPDPPDFKVTPEGSILYSFPNEESEKAFGAYMKDVQRQIDYRHRVEIEAAFDAKFRANWEKIKTIVRTFFQKGQG